MIVIRHRRKNNQDFLRNGMMGRDAYHLMRSRGELFAANGAVFRIVQRVRGADRPTQLRRVLNFQVANDHDRSVSLQNDIGRTSVITTRFAVEVVSGNGQGFASRIKDMRVVMRRTMGGSTTRRCGRSNVTTNGHLRLVICGECCLRVRVSFLESRVPPRLFIRGHFLRAERRRRHEGGRTRRHGMVRPDPDGTMVPVGRILVCLDRITGERRMKNVVRQDMR